MRSNEISIQQQVVNFINSKQEFTFPKITKRYVVGVRSLYIGKNPSQTYGHIYEDVYKVTAEILDLNKSDDVTIGGWMSEGLYYVDEGRTLDNLEEAMAMGQLKNQQYIYDTVEGKDIKVV